MAAITTSKTIAISSGIADGEEIRAAFTEHRRELTWLAEFLTDDEQMASACAADARHLPDNTNTVLSLAGNTHHCRWTYSSSW